MGLLSDEILQELIDDEFKALSRMRQIEYFLEALCKEGITTITCKDISEIFKDANMRSPEHQKKIRCGAFKVKDFFDLMSDKSLGQEYSVTLLGLPDDTYEISLN